MATPIKVINGSLDVVTINGEENFALKGVIDPESLQHILVPSYQREVLGSPKIEKLKKALQTSRVPEIDLGMRGDNVREMGDGVFFLQDKVFVIDGLQRKTAGERLVESGQARPHIGALIHFNTTEEWERRRFTELNTGQTGLSNNVMLRNLADQYDGAKVMHYITTDQKFILCGKVAWKQNMRVGHLITAITYYKTVGRLMSHAGPGKGAPLDIATSGIDKIIANVGRNNFIHNVRAFFQLIDETFGVANVAYRSQAVQLKSSFLMALAGVVSDHTNFWNGKRLEIPTDLKRKLAQFEINDPHVTGLAGSAGKAVFMLEQLLINHINSNKRTRRLERRETADTLDVTEEPGGDSE